jgi:hypothetical protein
MEQGTTKTIHRILVQKTVTTTITSKLPENQDPSTFAVAKAEVKTETINVYSQDVEGEFDLTSIICAVNGLKKPDEKATK